MSPAPAKSDAPNWPVSDRLGYLPLSDCASGSSRTHAGLYAVGAGPIGESLNIHLHMLAKPKLLYFRSKPRHQMSELVRFNHEQQVRCLLQFFQVTVIDADCDYQQVCDIYEPELSIFEMLSGAEFEGSRRPRIENILCHSSVHKIALLNADAFCEARSGFLSDMDCFGIDTAFSIATAAWDHFPSTVDNLYIWPNFVDPEVFRDYGMSKIIPVLFTGSQISLYPWRKKVNKLISQYYPTLQTPHRGYNIAYGNQQMPVGEAYARTINGSWVVPTCGTIAKEIVRKQFEIPACRSCLVTQQSPNLEAAGFVDMKSCVFADSSDILDKLEYLFKDEAKLQAITDEGYSLVRSRHTLAQRSQILQWLKLRQAQRPGQAIIQVGPFDPLCLVDENRKPSVVHVKSEGEHLVILEQADTNLREGSYDKAKDLYLKCLTYIPWMPEPKLKLAICALRCGQPRDANNWLQATIRYSLESYGAAEPDPVEWAHLILCCLCLGQVKTAVAHANRFGNLKHVELGRARWAAHSLAGAFAMPPDETKELKDARSSVHTLPILNFLGWVEQVSEMLCASNRGALARSLRAASVRDIFPGSSFRSTVLESTATRDTMLPGDDLPHGSRNGGYFPISSRFRAIIRTAITSLLHGLERKYGYFLPFRISEARNDEFLSQIWSLAGSEDMKSFLVVGGNRWLQSTRALLAGMAANPSNPKINYLFQGAGSHCNLLSLPKPDLVLINVNISVADSIETDLLTLLQQSKVIVLNGIRDPRCFDIFEFFSKNRDYLLMEHDPELRAGHAVFTKHEALSSKPVDDYTALHSEFALS